MVASARAPLSLIWGGCLGGKTVDRVVAYQLDAQDRITFVSPEWVEFAARNGAPDLTPPHVLGRLIWGFIAGADVKRLYQQLFHHVRGSCCEVVIPLRIDAPGVRRFGELSVSPLADDELDIEVRVLRTEARPALPVLSPDIKRSSRWLTICSWCMRVRVDVKLWVELDDPLGRSGLVSGITPHLTYSTCPDCAAKLEALASE